MVVFLAALLLATGGGVASSGSATVSPTAGPGSVPPSPALSASGRSLVVCSPGSPGTTAQAQPTMDHFAGEVAAAAGWPPGSLIAAYYETAEGGIEALAPPTATLALVPPAFLFEFGRRFALHPRLEAIPQTGRGETYSLVARKGALPSSAALAGWEILGSPGFSPAFVRQVLLRGWGPVPDTAKIAFSSRVLGNLRRAASGEKVAALLDRAQTGALPTLPFAADLEVVFQSDPLPSGLLCRVGDRMPAAEFRKVVEGLLKLSGSESGREALQSMRLERFVDFAPSGSAAWEKPSGGGRP